MSKLIFYLTLSQPTFSIVNRTLLQNRKTENGTKTRDSQIKGSNFCQFLKNYLPLTFGT